MVGGHDGHTDLNTAERFVPASNRWEPLPPMAPMMLGCVYGYHTSPQPPLVAVSAEADDIPIAEDRPDIAAAIKGIYVNYCMPAFSFGFWKKYACVAMVSVA